MRLQDVKRREHTPVAKHSGPGMARAEPARDGGFCVFAKGVCSLKPARDAATRNMLPEARSKITLCLSTDEKKPVFSDRFLKYGRRERIRTSDPLVPNQLRYQAALLADFFNCFAWCEERDLNPHVR